MLSETGDVAVVVPPTIQALLAARLDQLDPVQRAVLERGAVEGEVFHRGALQTLAPDAPQLTTSLTALVRKELLRPDQAQIAGEEAFRFSHLLIRDAAYARLSKADRADLHQQLAGWLEDRGRDLVELEELLGYHLEQAYGYRTELGPLDEQARGVGARAGLLLASAGERALYRRDMRAAVNLLSRAVSLQPRDAPAVSLRLDLADALQASGPPGPAAALASEAADLATAAGDHLGALRARLHAEVIIATTDPQGATARVLALVEEARPLFEFAGDELGLTKVWMTIGNIEAMHGHAGAADDALARAAVHARHAQKPRQVQLMLTLAAFQMLDGPTPVKEALNWLDTEGAALELERHIPWLTGQRAVLEAMLGNFEDARKLLKSLSDRVAELGLTSAAHSEYSWRVETLAGAHAAAAREARRAYELLEQSGAVAVASTQACLLAQSLCRLGRDDEAAATLAAGEEFGASDDTVNQILVPQVRAKLLARRGEHESAERLAREAVAIAEQTDWLETDGDALTDLAEVLTLAGRHVDASTELKRALELYEQKGHLVSAAKTRDLLSDPHRAVPARG